MKILHTSDWHLGLDFYGASLLRDQEAMVDRIADIAARERVGAVPGAWRRSSAPPN